MTLQTKSVGFKRSFHPLLRNARAQAAEMTIAPGKSEGGPDNRHRGADQWLFVISGSGVAVSRGRSRKLKRHSLLLIGRGDTHEIRNTGSTPLRTLNIYVPPAYKADGDPLPAGRSGPKRR